MRPRLRELMGEAKLQAADLVRTWGFPRELGCHELVLGHWFEWGPGLCIFWIVAGLPNLTPGWAAIHVRVVPGSMGLVHHARFLELLPVLGDLLGLEGYEVTLLEPRLGPVLERAGWARASSPGGWYLSLHEGELDGWGRRRCEGEASAS